MITGLGVHLIPHCWNQNACEWACIWQRETQLSSLEPLSRPRRRFASLPGHFLITLFPRGTAYSMTSISPVCSWHRHLVPWCRCGLCSLKPNMLFEHTHTHSYSQSLFCKFSTFMLSVYEWISFSRKCLNTFLSYTSQNHQRSFPRHFSKRNQIPQ